MDNKSPLEYLVNFSTLQNFILNLTYFLLYIDDLSVIFFYEIAFYLDNRTFSLKCTTFLICGSSFCLLALELEFYLQ